MPRPMNFRRVGMMPVSRYYKPQGIPLRLLEQVDLTIDEVEAVRLVDLEGLYQADAAEKMKVSRQTIGRILDSAHKKIADALVNGKALAIEGGNFQFDPAVKPPVGPPWRHRNRGGQGRGHGHGRRHS